MKKKKVKKQKSYIIFITIIIVLLFFALGAYFYYKDELGSELKKEGYNTNDKDEIFYSKITTNNTLEEFYDDIANNKDSSYEEFYFTKSSYDFIELKMSYKNGINYTLNISSDIKRDTTNYNYEVSNSSAHLILEGNNLEGYDCKIVKKENISNDSLTNHCNYIKKEIENFINIRNEFLKNDKIKEIIDNNEK